MTEQVLYRKRGIRLTTDLLEIRGGGRYPLQAIQGATVREVHPDRRRPVLCMLGGLFPPLFPLLPIGVIWFLRQRSTYWLSLETEYGTVEPLGMTQPQRVQELQAALLQALEARALPQQAQTRLDRLRQQLLTVAQEKGGEVSVTDGVLATGCSFGEVKGLLDEMLASGYVQLDNHWETGVLIYRFPELLAETSPRSIATPDPTPEQLRQQLLSAAQTYGGSLSVTQGVLATGQSFATVQALLDEMAASGPVRREQGADSGGQVYHFPELMRPRDRTPVDRIQFRDSPPIDPGNTAAIPTPGNPNTLPVDRVTHAPHNPVSNPSFKRLTRDLLIDLRKVLDSIVGSP